MNSPVALPGLTTRSEFKQKPMAPEIMSLPQGKNPFATVDTWTDSLLKDIKIEITSPEETTSDFTRKKNPNNRYWKSTITFKYGSYESKIIKMSKCGVPTNQGATYGTDYIHASLQRSVGEAIVRAALDKDIIATIEDKKVHSDAENWWMTINNCSGKIGIVDANGDFEPKDAHEIMTKTGRGMRINLDLVFSLRLTITGGASKTSKSTFVITPDCSRGAIMSIGDDIQPPSTDTNIPQQKASRGDIASQELISALNALAL